MQLLMHVCSISSHGMAISEKIVLLVAEWLSRYSSDGGSLSPREVCQALYALTNMSLSGEIRTLLASILRAAQPPQMREKVNGKGLTIGNLIQAISGLRCMGKGKGKTDETLVT